MMGANPPRWGRGATPVRPIVASGQRPVAVAQPTRKESDYLVPMLPFDTKERGIQEYKARNPHRKFINEKMTRIEADWVDAKVGDLDLYSNGTTLNITDDDAVEETELTPPTGESVNARVLLSSPLVEGGGGPDEKHILQRIELIGCSVTTPTRQLRAYGGLVPASPNNSDIIAPLISIVKAQSGLDLSSVQKWTRLGTIVYETGTPPTVFFYPHLATSDATLSMHPLVKTVEQTIEEEVDAGTQKTETSTKSTVNKIMIPVRMSLSTLRHYALAATTYHETYELCAAVDLFDEWYRRDCISAICDNLTERLSATDFEVEAETQARLRKKRLLDEEAECKRRKESKIALLKKQWELDDVGKTDEDKKDSAQQRVMLLRDLDHEERRQMDSFVQKQHEESEKEKQKTKSVEVLNVRMFENYQFIDRPRGAGIVTSTQINRDWLAQQLLCLKEERTYGECIALTTQNGKYKRTEPANYVVLSTDRKPVSEVGPDKNDDAIQDDE